jgi:hypothetical protein
LASFGFRNLDFGFLNFVPEDLMKSTNASIDELCRLVESGDPEAARRYVNQIMPLMKRKLDGSRSVTGSLAGAGESSEVRTARQMCRAIVARLQARRRATRDETLGGRRDSLTITKW